MIFIFPCPSVYLYALWQICVVIIAARQSSHQPEMWQFTKRDVLAFQDRDDIKFGVRHNRSSLFWPIKHRCYCKKYHYTKYLQPGALDDINLQGLHYILLLYVLPPPLYILKRKPRDSLYYISVWKQLVWLQGHLGMECSIFLLEYIL